MHKWSRELRPYIKTELLLPSLLYAVGIETALSRQVVGMGGTRSPGVETFELVAAIAHALSEGGICTISGGVPGVDLACHLASASSPGGTVAVLANPVLEGLAANGWGSTTLDDEITKNGLFVSEYAERVEVGGDEFRERLLQRDRIISGLSNVFLAFECNVDSATVDTARRALAQGAIVMAVHPPVVRARRGTFELSGDPRVISIDARTSPVTEITAAILSKLD